MEAGRSPNVEIISNAEVKQVTGSAGNFQVKIEQRPRYVDVTKCTACGMCSQYCPVIIPDSHNQNLSIRKAIDITYTQAIPSAYSVNPEYCLFLNKKQCKQCTRVCLAGAINFDQKLLVSTLNVGAVILCTGFKQMSPSRTKAYRYKDCPNVVTGLEFERISSASGPYLGKISRPSDLKKPHRIAFIQCAGSRDKAAGKTYCSSVCCKYAIKDTIVALEHEPDLDITVFFMDMRLHGKGMEAFQERAEKSGVRFIRSRVSGVKRNQAEDLTVQYVTEDGSLKEEVFNLVVLPMGLEAPDGNFSLARAAGVGLNGYGFCRTDLFAPVSTSREGVYVAGGFKGPMALPDSVMQASGAAALASELLAPARRTLITQKPLPEEIPVANQPLRIGVFVCNCGKNIGGVVSVPEVQKYAATLADVVVSRDNLYSCSGDAQALIRDVIIKEKLNRVVIAACSPRTHEPVFQETLRDAGLNKCLIEMVNIRDQCSWVHAHEKEAATEKAKDLVRMAVAKAKLIGPLAEPLIDVIPKALVIGGGLAGMSAALSVANQGFECYLIEKSKELGGNLRHIRYTLEGDDPQENLRAIIGEVRNHKLISIYTEAEVQSVRGFIGNFDTTISVKNGGEDKIEELRHGAIILATGAVTYRPEEYLYGKNTRVLLQHELEGKLADSEYIPKAGDNIVMIQCVGSRDERNPYCSSICCSMAIKNALKIKELSPSTSVYVLYRDLRTYGFHEDYYREARERGVIFIRYNKDAKPVVEDMDGAVRITTADPILKRDVSIDADFLVLSSAIIPPDNSLDKAFSVPRSADGFYLESHVQLRPVDSYIDGVFICGMAHFPKPIDEAIAQAKAAAAKAANLLARGYVKAEPVISACDQGKCIGCGMCEDFCPYGAIRMTKVGKLRKAETIAAACKGCGICASYCPAQAISMGRFTSAQIMAQIVAFGQG